jgi:predicted TPR repeat methyltransferase
LARYAEAVSDFDKAISLRADFAATFSNKARSLYLAKRFEEALAVHDTALALRPDWGDAWFGRGEVLQALKRPEEAVASYRQALAKGGNAEIVQYALASLGAGASPVIAPREYTTTLFDQYAGTFEKQLVGTLKYRTPESLFDALAPLLPSRKLDILDMGCGTGLVGSRLAPLARTLTGVDISPNMLEVARRRHIYDDLICSELTEFLRTRSGNFDLAVAADVFVYIGELSEVFRGVRAVLREGGFFAFSVEASEDQDFVLRATRRYAHSRTYLRRLAADHAFVLQSIEPHVIRQEEGVDVIGDLAVLRCG